MSRRVLSIVLALSALLVASRAFADDSPASYPLADRVPNDAFVYFGWQGADVVGPTMTGTHLQAILAQSSIEDVFRDFAPRAIQKFVAPEHPDQAQMIQSTMAGLGVLWRHPTAIFISGITATQPTPGHVGVVFKGAVVCRAGADAAAMKQMFAPVMAQANAANWPSRIFDDGDLTCFAFGYGDSDPVLAADASKALGSADLFKAATAPMTVKPVVGAFVDVPQLVTQVRALPMHTDKQRAMIDKVMAATGIAGLHTVAHACGFDGADWMSESFMAAPSPRTGLFSAESGAAISDDLLKHIPRTATSVIAGQHDLAGFVTALRDGLKQVNPKAAAGFNAGLGAIQLATTVRPIQDVLAPLGTDWAAYMSDDIGDGIQGLIILNKMRDPATASAKYPLLQSAVCNIASAVLQRQQIKISSGTIGVGDTTVNYIDLPFASPSWAIKDGYLYLGLYPQTLGAALRHPMDQSILDEPKYRAVVKRLGDKPAHQLTYQDLPHNIGVIYNALLLYERIGAGFAAMRGVQVEEPVIPPYDVLLANTTPAGSVTWVDDAGVHNRAVSPFPGAALASPEALMSVGGAALATSVALPAAARAREQAIRIKCMQNERQIGMAITMWCSDHNGQYPPDFGSLLLKEEIPASSFLCPDSGTSVPGDFAQLTAEQRAQWVNDHSDYVYVGKGLTQGAVGADTVVLYDKPGNHEQDGINILYGDGHVEFVFMNRARELIQQH